MPITKSAKKAIRGSLRKKVNNLRRKDAMKDIIKKVEKLAKTNKAEAAKILSTAFQAIDKAVKQNIIKANNGARKKSRLSRLVK